MILASDVFTDVKSFLDDDSSGRYDATLDLVPAINKAILYLITLFNTAFDAKKITPESLRELVYTKILPVTGTTTKKVDVTNITDNLWSILGVDPDPVVTTITPTPPAVAYDILNETRNRFAKRMTLEEWNDALADPFSAGTGVSVVSDLIKPGYIGPGLYCGNNKYYLMVRPGSIFTTDKVCIWYLKNPAVVISGSSEIEFPQSLYQLLVDKTINALAIQHSPESAYGKVTDKEVSQLVSLMLS